MSKTFRIQVSDKIIQHAPALFNATLQDIFTELLQNSRRAEATHVRISIDHQEDQDWLIIEDDGRGLFHHGVDITLGDSHWNEAIQNQESPSGMGLFSLAHRGCIIEANQKRVQLQPEHFTGQDFVEVLDTSYNRGTSISFLVQKEDIGIIKTILPDCVRYYPLPVYWQGNVLPRKDFMADADYVETWEGLDIGVCSYGSGIINFYGLTIEAALPLLSNCLVSARRLRLSICINVIDAPKLRLTLPSRKEVVQNDFFEQLKIQALFVICRYLGQLGQHYLPFDKYLQAKASGIDLPVAHHQLLQYEPAVADDMICSSMDMVTLDYSHDYWVVNFDAIPAIQQIFDRGFHQAYPHSTLLASNSDMEGYDWYDQLTRITSVSIILSYGDSHYGLSEVSVERINTRPDAIALTMIVVGAAGEQEHTFPLDIAFWDAEEGCSYNDPSSLDIFIPEDSTIDVSDAVELMFDSFFIYSDDIDADSYETQGDYFRTEAEFAVMNLLGKTEEATKERIEAYVRQHLLWLVGSGKQCIITIDKRDSHNRNDVIVDIE